MEKQEKNAPMGLIWSAKNMANVEIIESKETENLMKDEKAFLLLIKIGYKTVLSDVFDIPPVRIGWAFLSGAESVALTKQEYRTAKKNLEKWGIAEFEKSNKGTYARIITNKFIKITECKKCN